MWLQWFGSWRRPYFDWPVRSEGYLLLTGYLFILGFILYRTRSTWLKVRERWPLFLTLLVSSVFLHNAFLLHIPVSPLPPASGVPFEPAWPLFAALPVVAAAAWLGTGPAAVIALAGGVTRGAFFSYRLLQPLELAFFGAILGFLLKQEYQGRLWTFLRQPLIATPLASFLSWLTALPSVYTYIGGSPFQALSHCWTFWNSNLPGVVALSALAGLIVQLLYWGFPRWQPIRRGHRSPPYSRSLNLRILFSFVPLTMIIIAVLFYAVTVTAIRVATRQIVSQTWRDASNAAQRVPLFFHTGQALLTGFVQDEGLRSEDSYIRQAALERLIRSPAFFDQLTLLDTTGQVENVYPIPPTGTPILTDEEKALAQRTLSVGATQVSTVHRGPQGNLVISFIFPIEDARGTITGALIGRAGLDHNPMMQGLLSSLQGTMGAGTGFIVDEQDRIIAHPITQTLLSPWKVSPAPLVTHHAPEGMAYEDRAPDGSQRLVFYLPVKTYPWAMVITLPYEVILAQATEISTPLLALLVLTGTASILAILLLSRQLTLPLARLAHAADQMAIGRLDTPVGVSGEDEVGRLGITFERMRTSLKERLEELSLLLKISQEVSRSLDLERGLTPILEGAMRATGAVAARITLLPQGDDGQRAVSTGSRAEALARLDAAIPTVVQSSRPLVIENLTRARKAVDPALLQAGIRALVGLPLRMTDRTTGVMWIAYDTPRWLTPAEMGFLSTLAGQAAVVAENARLFAAAERGRRRLAAILSSTADAIVVTDRHNRILLVNPAAEQAFGLSSQQVMGTPLEEAISDANLRRLLTQPLEGQVLTEEIPAANGRILYASVSAVESSEGTTLGRVAVMRDITHLKELDRMKSEFVNTVSHDLRSPLTFMRGYVTMIPMVGEVNEKQQEFVDKIIVGIEQMTALIDNLLDIGKIEAGVGIEMTPCRPDEVVRLVVSELRSQAEAKGLDLRLEIPPNVPIITADIALLRQAVANLVDNAIKYTFSGSVTVGMTERDSYVVIWVRDTGLGIPASALPRLFEKFFRVKRRETIRIKGTGLGLAIVKSIAERHGGKVWAQSREGEGSTFYLALPIHPPENSG